MEDKKRNKSNKNANTKKENKEIKKHKDNKEITDFKDKVVDNIYCGSCGKKLKDGEVCGCLEKSETIIQINKDLLSLKSKSILDMIFAIYKKPYSACKKEFESRDINNSMITLLLIAFSFGLLICSLTYALFHNINPQDIKNTLNFSGYNSVPYFKIFVVWSLISFIMGFLPIIVSHLACTLFSTKKYDFNNYVNLYASSLSVIIIINAISSVFIFSGVFIRFFLLASLFSLVFGIINYVFIYRDLVNFEKEKESYIFLGIFVIMILGMAVISNLFTTGIDGLNAFETISKVINN